MKKNFIPFILFIVAANASMAQLGDIIKRKAGGGAKQGTQTGTEKAIDKGIDKLFKKKDKNNKTVNTDNATGGEPSAQSENTSIKTYSKYDFIPGEKVIGFDDFSQDAVGDFPGKWTTNASGEIMT